MENTLLRPSWKIAKKKSIYRSGFNLWISKPHVIALIVPDFVQLKTWCEANNIHWTAPQFMVINPKVEKLFKTLLDDVNAELTRHEHIKGFHLAFEPWTTEEGFITGTLKPKRRIIEERFSKEIEELYKK
ncbi:MAG: hypothetical protein R2879_13840 [Saprospiraceae bacterium]